MKTDQLNAYNGTLNNDSSLYGEINSASLLLHGFFEDQGAICLPGERKFRAREKIKFGYAGE